METDREIKKLNNVLRRIGRAAGYAAWNRDADAALFCVRQYNKVLARLIEIESAVVPLFTPLPETASPEVTRLASHELAAFFEDEAPQVDAGFRVRVRGCGSRRGWAGVRVGSCW